jgi:hypothetical protein
VSLGGAGGYPGAGVARSTGTGWGTSYTVGTAANNLVQLNGSSQLPAVSGALLTNLPATSICTDNPAPGAWAPTLTAGHVYCLAVGTYTVAAAITWSVANVQVLGSGPGTIIQRTGTTDLFDFSGVNGLLRDVTLDGNSQSGAGTGCLVCVTGGTLNAYNVVYQNTGTTSPQTGTIYITTGTAHTFKDHHFLGTQADRAFYLKAAASTTVAYVLVDHLMIDNCNMGATSVMCVSADDNAASAAVPYFTVINSTVLCQGGNANCMGTSFNIAGNGEGSSPGPIFVNDTVKLLGQVSDGFHFFGFYHGIVDVIFDNAGQAVTTGIDFGDAYFNKIGFTAKCLNTTSTACVYMIDGGRNTFAPFTCDGGGSSVPCIKLTNTSGVNNFNVLDACTVYMRPGVQQYGIAINNGSSTTIATTTPFAASSGSVTNITKTGHGFNSSASPYVYISGGTGSWAGINGRWPITYIGANSFSIPVNSSGFGALSGTIVYDQYPTESNSVNCKIVGDGTANQIGVQITNTAGAAHANYGTIVRGSFYNVATGVSIGSNVTGTVITPSVTMDSVATPISDSGTGTRAITHTITGSGSLVSASPSTLTVILTGNDVFTTGHYQCTASNQTTATNALSVTVNSGTSFTITGPNSVSDTAGYICMGY